MRKLALAITALATCWTFAAHAMDLDPKDIRGSSSKEPVEVLQNRYFLKAFRPEFGLLGGVVLNEAYTNTQLAGLRGGMFIDEWIGFELQYLRTRVRPSTDRTTLEQLKYRPLTGEGVTTVSPEVNAIHVITEANAVAAPLYGKINILNAWIVYTDIYATAGLANVMTDQGNKGALSLGAGERFYIGRSWSVRIDYRDRIYTEKRGGTSSRRHAQSVDFGLSYFFL
ncbi:MAG: outer membrane beta-barrel domain-containing protein [Deltaproteobacteria bacterium]|nr:outer membrane beta-barrel domain-containing protein [Deltaproteobacteria bacterium]